MGEGRDLRPMGANMSLPSSQKYACRRRMFAILPRTRHAIYCARFAGPSGGRQSKIRILADCWDPPVKSGRDWERENAMKKELTRIASCGAVAAAAVLALTASASAQWKPTKTVEFIVPAGTG